MDSKELYAAGKGKAPGDIPPGRPMFTPNVDILETKEALVVIADMPGVDLAGVRVHFENSELSIRGRMQEQPAGRTSLYSEYREGDYYRAFKLSNVVDHGKIEAVMKNGVLKITCPRTEAAKPRRVEVKTG
jgi:HSP20 family protein